MDKPILENISERLNLTIDDSKNSEQEDTKLPLVKEAADETKVEPVEESKSKTATPVVSKEVNQTKMEENGEHSEQQVICYFILCWI